MAPLDRLCVRAAGREPQEVMHSDADTLRAIRRLGLLVVSSVLIVASSAIIACSEIGLLWWQVGAIAILLSTTVYWLYGFVLSQPTLLVSPDHRMTLRHAAALTARVCLFGVLALVVAQPLGAFLAETVQAGASTSSLLSLLHTTPWHHPLRLSVTAGVGVVMMAPVGFLERLPEGSQRIEALRSFLVAAYERHREAVCETYRDGTGRAVEIRESFEDPPFNTIPLRLEVKTQPRGTLLDWALTVSGRGGRPA